MNNFLIEIVTVAYSLLELAKFLMKSPKFEKLTLTAEIFKNFSKIWSIKTNFGQNRCPIMWKFTLSERYFNKLSYFFDFMKKSYLVLKL